MRVCIEVKRHEFPGISQTNLPAYTILNHGVH